MKNGFLYLTVFSTGFVIMALEFICFRLLASTFGGFIFYILGLILSTLMIALVIGYFLGGYLGDKKPDDTILFILILIANIYLIIMYFLHNSLLQFLKKSGYIFGPIFASLLIFGIPMLLLSTASPFIIKLVSKRNKLGMSAGKVFGISTFGSIMGTLVTSFIFIPIFGPVVSLYICTSILTILTIIGLVRHSSLSILIILLLVYPYFYSPQAEKNLIYHTQSPYNDIKIYQRGNYYILTLNKYSQSLIKDNWQTDSSTIMPDVFGMLNIGGMIFNPEKTLILGMGGGSSVIDYLKYFDTDIDVVEIDSKLIDIAFEYFSIPKNHPGLNFYAQDARPYLALTNKKYDLIELDVYDRGTFIPFYVATVEFFQLSYNTLNPEGILLVNVFISNKGNPLYLVLGNTLKQVFPSVYQVFVDSNVILIATKADTSLDEIKQKISQNNNPALTKIKQKALNLEEFKKNNRTILTDDKAPIEYLYMKRLMNLKGDIE